jgi:serine/threonine-protein kinase
MKLVENAVVAGKFRLNRMLGAGGMGSVWHATHLGLDIPCAVKFVKGELLEQDDIKARFEREAKAAASLRSPHVVQILDHGVCEGTPYIAMELLDGEDLGSRLERVGRLPVDQLYKVLSEACRALAKAHSQGIVHRDLKPDNIYIVRDDDREITKVLDFGIAKTLGHDVGGSGTKTGAMLGTPYYMSPEQAQGTKAVDLRSDLWALAVIAFQCLTGRLPFESEALGDLLVKIIVAPIPFPSQYAPVPPGFDKWWAKASSRDPIERFQSAKEFSDALALVCGVSQVSGVIDVNQIRGVAQGSAPSVQTGNASTGARSDLSPLAAGTTASALTPTPLARSYVDPAVPKAGKTGVVLAMVFGGLLFLSVVGGAGWFMFGRGGSAAASAASAKAAASVPTAAEPPVASAQDTSAAAPSAPPSASAVPEVASPAPSAAPPVPTPSRAKSAKPAPASPPVAKPGKSSKPVDMGF